MHKLKGDTLVEVTIATAIFSLVVISVVAVVNNSTAGAQTALETTLTREEIDTQAEALRFIQSSYASSLANYNTSSLENDPYKELWGKITTNPLTTDNVKTWVESIYSPKTCSELYENEILQQHAFAINPRMLGSSSFSNAIISFNAKKDEKKIFQQAITYPHIVYSDENSDQSILGSSTSVESDVSSVEGLYVFAVRDPGETAIYNGSSNAAVKVSAYYDFYINSCWYSSGSETPSTISTIIRLYDPAVLAK